MGHRVFLLFSFFCLCLYYASLDELYDLNYRDDTDSERHSYTVLCKVKVSEREGVCEEGDLDNCRCKNEREESRTPEPPVLILHLEDRAVERTHIECVADLAHSKCEERHGDTKVFCRVQSVCNSFCVVKIRKREPMNILFGPPSNRDDANRMMALFFSKEGKHIICGGTTSSIASKYLGKPVRVSLSFEKSDIPPIAHIEGVDLVTEGVITMNKVIQYAKDYLEDNQLYEEWSFKKDGASLISQLLFEEATDINFYVGRAVNPAHQNPDLPINFNIKMNLVEELSACLKRMGKRIKVSYF